MEAVKSKKKIGERLIEAGLITQKQLEVALKEQKRLKEPLGQILVSLGFIDSESLTRTIAEEWGVEFVRMKDIEVDRTLFEGIDERFAKEHLFVPVRKESPNCITVAMTDPSNLFAIDAIQNRFGMNINVLAATHEDILACISSVYSDEEVDSGSRAESRDLAVDSFSVVEAVDEIIDKALSRRATDIHIEPEEKLLRIRYRMDGILQQGDIFPASMTQAVVTRFKVISDLDITERRKPQDGRFTQKKGSLNVDFRVSTMPTAYGENIVIRLLDRSSVSLNLKSLGVTGESYDRLKKIADASHGLFLVSGPTGSGKTTTLYAMILEVDAMSKKVVTVEDPIEYKLPLIRQSQVDNEVGYTFSEGLRTILRQDPDVILIGEIRDPETADIAVKSSMTGHMVFSSIHTNSAMEVIQRLEDLGVERYLISSTLLGAMGQRLVRRICSRCKEAYKASPAERRWLGVEEGDVPLYRGKGCGACHRTGYTGRTVIYELFTMDDDFADLIARGGAEKDYAALARSKGRGLLIDEGRKKVLEGITTISEVMRVCNDVDY